MTSHVIRLFQYFLSFLCMKRKAVFPFLKVFFYWLVRWWLKNRMQKLLLIIHLMNVKPATMQTLCKCFMLMLLFTGDLLCSSQVHTIPWSLNETSALWWKYHRHSNYSLFNNDLTPLIVETGVSLTSQRSHNTWCCKALSLLSVYYSLFPVCRGQHEELLVDSSTEDTN